MKTSVTTLTTPSLELFAYSFEDKEKFIALNTNPVVREKMDGHLSREVAARLFEKLLLEKRLCWAVRKKEDPAYIGHCFLDKIEEGDTVELGFLLFPEYWGQGFASEIAKRLKEHAFTLGYATVLATVDDDHIPSIRVLEKSGFVKIKEVTDEQGIYFVYTATKA